MVGSIDPRCETVRGIHWPKKGREVVWSSRRGSHLGQRSKATASTGRTYGCKRSDQTLKELLWHGGRPHMDSGLALRAPRNDIAWPLRHAGPQNIVEVHDTDRLVGIGHDQGGDLRGVENFQRLAGEQVAGDRLRVFGHDVVD